MHPPRIPASSFKFQYTFGLGGLSLLSFVITVLTGILLLFEYSPAVDQANSSLQYIATVLPFGWYLRNLHYWAAQVMVVSVLLHASRVMLTGGYLSGRRFNWVIGIFLLALTFLMDFTGFTLRWDVESHWALVVGTNLLKSIPLAGNAIYQLVTGGQDISQSTLLRFYTWHIFALPFIAFCLMIYHFWRIRKDGGISAPAAPSQQYKSRYELLQVEFIFSLYATALLIIASGLFTPHLGVSAQNEIALSSVDAPWIFLWIQFLLRYLTPFSAGILIPSALLLFWMFLPYADGHDELQGLWFAPERKKYWLPFLISIAAILFLTISEALLF